MCYSAMVNQQAKKLSFTFHARVQIDMFETLFKARLEGSGAKIPKAMEAEFLVDPKTAAERRIEKYIREFTAAEITKNEKELFAQTKRLADAERTLLTKVTKKAQNDQRIATDKIEKIKFRLERLSSAEVLDSDSRIYPGMYAPLVFLQDGERVVAPFRYLLRPNGQSPDFDRDYNGCYNARRDSLGRVPWWKSNFGCHHAIMEVSAFWENVKNPSDDSNQVLKFEPQGLDSLIVPCLFDFNTEGEFPLQSFALITDEPNPEVKAAGHDRTPIVIKEQYLNLWLTPHPKELEFYEPALSDKQPTYFNHRVSA